MTGNAKEENYRSTRKVNRLRNLYWRFRGVTIGKNVFIGKKVRFERYPQNVILEDNVIIGDRSILCPTNKNAKIIIKKNSGTNIECLMYAIKGITIGENCLIAPRVYIVDNNHGLKKSELVRVQRSDAKEITIGDDCWIGANSMVLAGVTIANGSVVGAMSLVNKNTEAFGIYAGIPAKLISFRKDE